MAAVLRRFWVKRPLFVMAAGLVAVIALSAWQSWAGFVAMGIFVAIVVIASGWKCGVLAAMLSLFLLGMNQWQDRRQAAEEESFSKLGLRGIEGRTTEDAIGENGRWSSAVRLYGKELEGRKVRWMGAGSPPPAGTELRAIGTFHRLDSERNPGTLDRAKRLRTEGVVAIFRADEMRAERWIGPFSEWAAGVKQGFREGITAGLEEDSLAAKVIRAVVIGERAPDSLELVRSFRESGTLHVFSVSGFHVAMVGSMVWLVLKWLNIARRWAIPLIIMAMFVYVWLTGNGPAALRAGWMGAVFLGAFALRRRSDLLNSLGLVLLVSMLYDVRIIRMPGVQLSYGVVAAIGLATGWARQCFEWIAKEDLFMPLREMSRGQRWWLGFRQKLAEAVAVSAAATIGSVPLTIIHFGMVSPISIFATVALGAQVYVLSAVALISALMHPVWEDGVVFMNRKNAWVALACVKTAESFASIPGAWAATRFPKEDTLVIYDLDYGASSACFASVTRNAVIIDAGGERGLENEVGPSLRRLGIEPDSVIFTRSDSRHAAGPELMKQMISIRQVAMAEEVAGWIEFSKSGARVIRPRIGDRIDLGNKVWAEILHSPFDGVSATVGGDRVLVFRMHWRGWRILWLGDAGRITEQALLDGGMDLGADVIATGNHESDLSLTGAFVAAVDPQAIVIARPPGEKTDFLRDLQRKDWKKKGILLIDQKHTGGLTVTMSEGGEMVFAGFADNSENILRKR
ncbi:MAG: ComEC/Rec2 family competence protein [Armatimonadetes bacterium]|nr:ComEC/Rec2 family competence protein [Akkermansiaceae bacterium]